MQNIRRSNSERLKKKKTLVVAAGYFGAMGEVDADAET